MRVCSPLVLAGADLEYIHQTKYLGVLLKASRQFKCSFDQTKIKFYRSLSSISISFVGVIVITIIVIVIFLCIFSVLYYMSVCCITVQVKFHI